MTSLIIQTLLLMAIAFILGAVIGCLLRNLFGSAEAELPSASAGIGAGAVAAGAVGATTMTRTPATPSAPAVPKPPMPAAPVEKPKVAAPAAKLVSTPKAATKLRASAKPRTAAKPKAKAAPVKRAPAKKAPARKAPAKRKPAAARTNPDNLKLIRGIGPQNEGRLNNMGVNRFAQVAAWSKKEQAGIGEALAFPGRIEREDWVGQAKVLAKGGATEFAKRVKSGEVGSSVGKANAGNMGKKPSGMLKAARGGKADNLTLIDGVGNAIEKKMFNLGIYHFDQVARMTKDELAWLGTQVGFPGRPERENWRGESKTLAKGGMTAHAKRVERGEIKSSRKS